MKTSFVTDLGSEQSITSFFLVHEKEIRNTREGKAYLRLELGDRSGTIEARMWDQFEAVAKDVNRDHFRSGRRSALQTRACCKSDASRLPRRIARARRRPLRFGQASRRTLSRT